MAEVKEGIISKLIDKAGEQGFSFIVMGFVCWVMYSMITQNKKDTRKEIEATREEFKQLREDYKDCMTYNRSFYEKKINEND